MRYLRFAAAAALMLLCHPLTAAASTEEYVTPECQKTLYYSVAELDVHFDRSYNGANISVYRTQEEGDFPYYSYDVRLMDETLMHCELIEGDYQMEITVPSSDGTEYISYPPITFSVKDPDVDKVIVAADGSLSFIPYFAEDPEIDKAQSFDRTVLDYNLRNDPELTESQIERTPSELTGRTIYEGCVFTAAGLRFQEGDLNRDGSVNATDAAWILIAAAEMGAGKDSGLTALQLVEADLTGDGIVNASDSAVVLQYAADHGTGSFTGDVLLYARIRAGKQPSA